MNVKSMANNIASVERPQKTEATKAVKTENTSPDRDADGRRQREEKPRKTHLNEEEMELVLKTIRNFDGVKNNNLIVELSVKDTIKVVLIKDLSGEVIRRIPEADLWSLVQEKDKPTGQIFDKAM